MVVSSVTIELAVDDMIYVGLHVHNLILSGLFKLE